MAEFSLSQHTESIYSIIGEGTKFKGEFEVSGLLRIDGDFTGTIKTSGKVLVSKNGRAECTIYGNTVIIGGLVKGNIIASEKVEILSSGMVVGTIVSPRLVVNEGVLLHGECTINPDSVITQKNKIIFEDKKSVYSPEDEIPVSSTGIPESGQESEPEAAQLEKKII